MDFVKGDCQPAIGVHHLSSFGSFLMPGEAIDLLIDRLSRAMANH